MTPLDLMLGRRARLGLVIFDCDGVLVDSEPVAGKVVGDELTGLGWAITAAESQALFLGLALPDMLPIIERRLGRTLPTGWVDRLVARLSTVLAEEAELVPGALAALTAASDLGLPWRIASNSSHAEMRAKFSRVGLTEIVAGRLHSAADVGRGKPEPDVFLAAAAAEQVAPAECLVVEDSVPGALAASRAGMPCLGYVSHGDADALRSAGAVTFTSMHELPNLFIATLRAAA